MWEKGRDFVVEIGIFFSFHYQEHIMLFFSNGPHLKGIRANAMKCEAANRMPMFV